MMERERVLRTRSNSIFNAAAATAEANQIARDLGLAARSEIDAFRHAYIAAKQSEAIGVSSSALLLNGYEAVTGLFRKNDADARGADIINNARGFDIQNRLDDSSLTDDDREYALRMLVFSRAKDGTLEQSDDNAEYYGMDDVFGRHPYDGR